MGDRSTGYLLGDLLKSFSFLPEVKEIDGELGLRTLDVRPEWEAEFCHLQVGRCDGATLMSLVPSYFSNLNT